MSEYRIINGYPSIPFFLLTKMVEQIGAPKRRVLLGKFETMEGAKFALDEIKKSSFTMNNGKQG